MTSGAVGAAVTDPPTDVHDQEADRAGELVALGGQPRQRIALGSGWIRFGVEAGQLVGEVVRLGLRSDTGGSGWVVGMPAMADGDRKRGDLLDLGPVPDQVGSPVGALAGSRLLHSFDIGAT